MNTRQAIVLLLLLAVLPARAGLVAEFLFNNNTQDSSGNANHGTFVGNPSANFTADRDGNPDSALVFDGIDDYLNISQVSGLPLTQHTEFTISGWVKGAANQTEKRIFSEGSTTNGLPLYNLSTRSSTDQLDIFIRGDPGTGTPPVDHFQPPATLYDDTWRHFTVIDRNGELTIFIDGVLQAGSPTYTRVPLTANTTTLGGILRAAASNFFAGALDDIRLYDSAVFLVTNTNDSGAGSLRQAIADAPSGATITFDPTTLDGETITLTTGQLLLDKDVTIDASDLSGGLTLDAQDASQIMFIDGSNGAPSVSLHGLTLTGGNSSSGGGAIFNTGATLALTHCTLFGNTAVSEGGAIFSSGPGASLALTHCTLTGNTATNEGGAIRANGTLTLRHCTLSGNTANLGGGVSFFGSDTFTLENSIVAGNTAPDGADIAILNSTNLIRVGANIVQNVSNSSTGSVTGPPANTDAPLLAPFGDYGGPTPTMLPLPGSPALDAALGFPGATDQRGLAIGDYVYENDFSTADLGGATVFTNIADLPSPPVQEETGTVADGSFLFTGEVSNQVAALVLPAPPEAFTTFAASFDLSYTDPSEGTGSGGPADGISFSFGSAPAANTFGGASGANAENGVPDTHRITLNTASFGGSPTFLRYIDPAGTTIASAPIDRFGDAGKVLPLTVTLDAAGTLTVTYKGELAFEVPDIGYTHTNGDTFTFAARTGGDRSEQRVDNIRILTSPIGGAPDIGAVEYDPTPVTAVVQNNLDDTTTFGTLRATLGWVPPGSTITFAQTLNGSTIALNGSRLPTINRNVTIDARALPGGLTIDAQNASQIMRILGSNGTPSVSLHGLTLTGGNIDLGGAIFNRGATLALTHCTLFGNSAEFGGGAIFSGNPGASLALTHCTLTGNTATGTNSQGGAINASGTLTLRHCTLSGNTAGNSGGGVDFGGNPGDTFTLENSIVAGNTAPEGADILIRSSANLTRVGANIVQNFSNIGTVPDSGPPAINAAPLLAPLGDYGGPTPTMPPLPGSPAIDAGGTTNPGGTDQRGFPRSSGIAPDIGAVELQHLLVTTAADEDNGNNDPANPTGTGTSLREAIAHLSPTRAEIITFAQTLNGSTIALNGTALPTITRNVTIDATTLSGGLTLDAQDASPIMRINGSNGAPSVSLHGLTLTGGNSDIDGGGAIANSKATLALTHCTLSGNTVGFNGGAIASANPGASLTLTHCTLTGNTATTSGDGGAILASGTLTLRHCTLSGNTASVLGGGVDFFGSGTFTLENSIVAGNTAPDGADILIRESANLIRVGANIVQNFTNSSSGNVTGPAAITAAPILAPLGNYGGPTQTMPPLPGSPAIDAAIGSTETTDQRGLVRPQGTARDIGAVEVYSTTGFVDTDGDGMDDRLEPLHGFIINPGDPGEGTRDADGDGSSNADELGNMTDPHDPASSLRILAFIPAPPTLAGDPRFDVTWTTFPGLSYTIEAKSDLNFGVNPREADPVTATGFTETLRVELDKNNPKDFIRVKRD